MANVTGNTTGLKPSQKKALERIFLRRGVPEALVGVELARALATVSRQIGRQVGVLLGRGGHVTEVFVGEPQRIYLPDLGRARAGLTQRRGIRHIHTVLGAAGLSRDDLSDLTKLRLDAVVAIQVTSEGEPSQIDYAYLEPDRDGRNHAREQVARDVFALGHSFTDRISSLEAESARASAGKATRVQGRSGRALVIGVYPDRETSVWRLHEIDELAQTAGVVVADTLVQIRRQIDSKFVVGRGKLEEATLRALDQDAEILIVDHNLTPAQARALAAQSELKVIDRTQLILDIFAQHAHSRDGKLQVELAQLKYTLPRLTDLDAGLSRLSGGIGGRGPGETKLEINRRRARDRIARLEREIEGMGKQRALRRRRREQGALPVISIVGYTNAGKSTLLAKLTQSEVLVADKLFATLDPTSRRLRFPLEREAILTDTVGFIRDLPPDLMRAFRATLEELSGADLLLHVIDSHDPDVEAKLQAVESLLEDLDLTSIPRMLVLNKSDLLENFVAEARAKKWGGLAVSAETGQGLAELIGQVGARLWRAHILEDQNAWSPRSSGEPEDVR